MAKETSPNQIRDYNDDWGRDTRNGLPYSGQSVQTFIKNNLQQAAGAAWFNQATMTLYFFRNADDRDIYAEDQTRTDLVLSSTVLNFSSEMFRVFLTNNNGSYDINAATNQTSVPISIDFDVQSKSISDSAWTSTGKGAYVRAYVDTGSTGAYVEIPNVARMLTAGTTFELDIRPYIAVGSNRIKVVFQAEDDENVTASAIYSVTLSQMYIEPFNNTWYNAIVEGDETNYKLGGFRIVGSASKTLHIEIYQEKSKLLEFEKQIGISSYSDVPYNYTLSEGLDLSSLGTGVFICRAYLTAGSLTSLSVSYNFMHVAEADAMSAQLVCVNNVATKVYNYSTAALCDYAIYNSGFSTGDPHILIQLWSGTTPTTKVDSDYAGITTGEAHTLEYTVEWLTEATIDLSVYFNITLGEASQVKSIPIDNSAVYPAEPEAAFYLNASSRSNNDANRESIINEATSPETAIPATWQRMAWVDGIDGWTTDAEGRKALLVPAGSKCTIPYQVMTGENITFEICMRVANVSDYDENIINIADNPTAPGFQGIRIRPTDITVHSAADIDDSKDSARRKSFQDEQTVHLLVTIQNSFGGFAGRNLVSCYINGCKNLEFDYTNGTAWDNTAPFIIGSSSADVYIYSCRVYRKVLGIKAAEQNYINSLRTLEDRQSAYELFNSVVDVDTHDLLYDKVVNSSNGYNFFVVEMKDGASVPSRANGWAKDTKGYSDFEMHYGKHPEWDFKLFGVETSGQGTTSMDYYRWNLRWRIDKTNSTKKIPVAYYDEPTTGLDGKKVFNILPSAESKTVFFDGGANGSTQQHPAVMRITAKINTASSMQSHKIGATRAYTALHDAIGLRNEAQEYAETEGNPIPAVAVYQYPAFGFARTITNGVESYEFIGLFTIGPDKGDKPTFGYDIDTIKPNLVTMEGTDHNRRMVRFQYPWNSEVEYRAANECLNIVINNSTFDNGWEIGNCHGLSTDEATDQAAIQTVLESEFKPAYDVVWNNSTLIFPVALNDATYGGANAAAVLANINANVTNFRAKAYDSRFGYSDMEFWIEGEYVLYHYDIVTGQYESGINLVTQNGTPTGATLDEKNEWFKAQRRARFFAQAPTYWDIQDAAYHFAFCVIFGATDNFAKNSYPYKMKTVAQGGTWKWRQDDLDTIFDTDNRGSDTKPYYIEFEDSENGSVIFAGSTSAFWNLLYETFYEDYGVHKGIESIGKDVVSAMANLGGGSNVFSGLVNFFKKYFWDNAQNYFPVSAYNEDAEFKYETAWLTNGQAVDPLSQSLGNHFEAEQMWCARRAIYVMSLFKVGAFASYSDTSLGQISFRPSSVNRISVKPTMWMYPALSIGSGNPLQTERTEAGDEKVFAVSADGQTTFYIQATDYMESLGDWKDIILASGYVDQISVFGAKLRNFKIGEADEYYTQEEIDAAQEGDDAYGKTTDDIKTPASVTTNIPGLLFSNTRCLEEIDARNAASLAGSIDLSVCTRLLTALFEGTGITQVVLPNGSKVVSLHLSDVTNTVILKNLKFLTDLVLPSDMAGIRTLQVENCEHQDAFQMLKDCYDSEDAALQYIRLIWSGIDSVSADDIHMLANIASGLKKDEETQINYGGINAQGNIEGNPVIEGTVQLQAGMYSTDLEPLAVIQTEDYPGGLKRALSSIFGTLYVIYNPSMLYINFVDDEVRRIAMANWGDGEGVTMATAAGVTSLGSLFHANTTIETFNELQYFEGLSSINGGNYNNGAFQNCSKLSSVVLPDTAKVIQAYAFRSCSALNSINLENVTTINLYGFAQTGLTSINAPSLTGTLAAGAFYGCTSLTNVINLGSITDIEGDGAYGPFRACQNLTSVILPDTLKNIGQSVFRDNTKLTTCVLPTSIESIGPICFYKCTSLIGDLNLPNLTSIGNQSFVNTKISKISSLGNITSLPGVSSSSDGGIFHGCTNLTEVKLPATLTSIGQYTFKDCSNLSFITIEATTPPSLGANAFYGTNSTFKIYVPYSDDHSILAAYQAATNWSAYASQMYELDANGEIPT